ncbi:unnamed protein product [Mycena citricolor]|uniref:Nephrocystin 3-like N-terminal domain-containing protein n=1 Tax=Mycena citricolor TaxID=2018698 RepID=A0AAD2H1B5_9AGAR|nr:unnamed protein product [Mycena citricolor]
MLDTGQPSSSSAAPAPPAREDLYSGEDDPLPHSIPLAGIRLLDAFLPRSALYDSPAREPVPRCHGQTRKPVFSSILAWTENVRLRVGPRIMWLCGSPGCGKSAVAQTVAEYCAAHRGPGSLGATFFFDHADAEVCDVQAVVPAIARQLAERIPALRPHISQAVQQDTAIRTRDVEVQAHELILEPFAALAGVGVDVAAMDPVLVVIDALDACVGGENQRVLLSLIARLIAVHHLPLYFFVTSRPSPDILLAINSPTYRPIRLHLHLDELTFDADIFSFLKAEFAHIETTHPAFQATAESEHWPTEDIIHFLVNTTARHFLYAATVMQYVGHPDGLPSQRLSEVLSAAANPAIGRSPFEQLVTYILSTVSPRDPRTGPASLLRALGSLTVLYKPLAFNELRNLLDPIEQEAVKALKTASPVVHVPEDSPALDLASTPWNPGHKRRRTIRIPQRNTIEFLFDARRAPGHLWVNHGIHHGEMARRCIRFLGHGMDDAEDGVDLITYQYVRKRWTKHLAHALPSAGLLDALRQSRFVYSRVAAEATAVISWLQMLSDPPHDILNLWQDWLAKIQVEPVIGRLV